MNAKNRRLERFFYPESKCGLIVPIDHGLTLGPLAGLRSPREIGSFINHPAVTGIIAHKGMVERLLLYGYVPRGGLMVHLNGMPAHAEQPDCKPLLTSIKAALRLSADAVSVQLNFNQSNDAFNLRLLGTVVDRAQAYGLPVLAMVYDKSPAVEPAQRIERLHKLMRLAIEMGVDALKIAAPTELSELPQILNGAFDQTPILFAGGPAMSGGDLLALARQAYLYGGSGLCVGRNIFQHPKPATILGQLHSILIQSAAVAAA